MKRAFLVDGYRVIALKYSNVDQSSLEVSGVAELFTSERS